ncbi:MAG: class I SAM-dependent methyltransferase [Geitlerinemataceae cyanobacterium]
MADLANWANSQGSLFGTDTGAALTEIVGDRIPTVASRFDRELTGKLGDLPEDAAELSVYEDWKTGKLSSRVASQFWSIAKPKAKYRCLDIGCGISFLIYPWLEWGAFFHGQDVSGVACDILKSRAPQLNSKLFKSITKAPAHLLEYEPIFDMAIATGFSCYYPLDYWAMVMQAVRKVLKPGGVFVFDAIDTETELADDWALLEMYLGLEVELESAATWKKFLKDAGVTKTKRKDSELFALYRVSWD